MSDLAKKIYSHKILANYPQGLDRNKVETFLSDSLDLIFPGMVRQFFSSQESLESFLNNHLESFKLILLVLKIPSEKSATIIKNYNEQLIVIGQKIKLDADFLQSGDPASESLEEILLCYPGLFAIATYRLAHFFVCENIPLLPRFLSEIAHQKTGIDIHPKAIIGDSFFIDHGTGVVIGETAIIGNFVKIYQGVTLGALSVNKSLAKTKRHPTIEDHCVIYSQATILGGETVIGKHSVIGGNVWMTKSVPAYSLVYHKSEVKLDTLNKQSKNINEQEELSYEI